MVATITNTMRNCLGNSVAKKSLNKASGIGIWGVIGLDDSYLSVWCWVGRATGQGGATESSAGASLTHVGQSSVEIGLMNRGKRAKRRGGWSFNITRHYQSKHQSSGQGRDGGSEGGISEAGKGVLETNHLLLNRRGYTCHWEHFETLYAAFHTAPWESAYPGVSLLHDISGSSDWLSLLFDGLLSSRRISLSFNLAMCRCKWEPIIRMSKGERTLGPDLLSPAKTPSPILPPSATVLQKSPFEIWDSDSSTSLWHVGHLGGEKTHFPISNTFLPFL